MIVNEQNAGEVMEKLLWEFIDIAGAFPSKKPDERTWEHVLVYMPKHIPIPSNGIDGRIQQEGI